MPTISELPSASSVSAADEIPISQGGRARAVSVGALLASTQAEIIVGSSSLLGRTSLGSGGPEQVDVGTGMNVVNGTLVADGQDHANFAAVSDLAVESDMIISRSGNPMRMQASLLRGLFTAGQNVAIDPNGVISSGGVNSTAGAGGSGSPIGQMPVVTTLAFEDLVPVSHLGSNCAISYGNFVGGVTIDQAQAANPTSDADTIWIAQGSNVMASQNFSTIWVWMSKKLATYHTPIIEITTNITMDTTVHNGHLLICSQPVTLNPLTSNMGSGFQCMVLNASSGLVTLGSGFVSSSGSLTLSPWQSATLSCVTYSAGTIAFAAMPQMAVAAALPGQVTGVAASAIASTAITVSWQTPQGGGVLSYIIQFRPTGTTAWNMSGPVVSTTTYQLSNLLPGTNYDIVVEAENSTGIGAASAMLTAATTSTIQAAAPLQVTGVAATSISKSDIQLGWSAQVGTAAATSFTVQYRVTGSSTWSYSVTGAVGTGSTISGLQAATSYDFSVIGVNSAGVGPASAVVTSITKAAGQSVSLITWNLAPSGTYTRGSGSIGLNAHVAPAASAIQFGFSGSAAIPPSSWTAAILVNTDLWGAYVPTPATIGSWWAWAAGQDGSAIIVSPNPFLVQ